MPVYWRLSAKNINLSEFLSKLGRFVCATFELRLRNIDKDSSWGRCQPIFIQEIGPTFCLFKKSRTDLLFIQKVGTTMYYEQKVGPIFCINKKSERIFCLYKKSDFDYKN